MDLYAATDMRLAVDDMDKLAEAISKGGVPMQQVVAAMLSRAGQYVRRERSFDGIAYNTPVAEVDRETYGQASTILKAIQDFSETYVKDATEAVKEEVKAEAESVSYDGSLGAAGARSTNFTAIMHNVINQMLLAFKAEEAASRAIAAIERGEKPVITASNTLETLLEEYAEDNDIKIGQEMEISFADVFRRYLERSRWITIKKPFSAEKGKQVRLTDAQLGFDGATAFREAMKIIDESKLDQLPGSPIDYVLSKIEAAGYKTAEITGRTHGLNYRDGTAYLKARSMGDRSIKGKIAAIRGFNDGTIDAIFLNRSGSTGLSLHASEKFKDKRKRRMILAQAEGNIDTHMQMLGRVHRTGQVVLPEYDQLVAGIPAEKRPAAVLAKKMASLNANTTASRDSALTSKEVIDFMNEYGDEVVARIMGDEPEMHSLLGDPLVDEEEGYDKKDAARRVTGRIPLLPVDMQDELYQRIEDEYRALLEQKDAAGENALEAKTFDLKAETLSSNEAAPRVHGSTSPFADGVNVERVSVVRLGKPYPLSEVVARVAASLGRNQGEGTAADLARVMSESQQAERDALMQVVRDAASFANEAISKIKNGESAQKQREHFDQSRARFQAIRRAYSIGSTVRLSTENGNIYGVITEVEKAGKSKNPVALGSWRMGVALVDASRHISIPFSQILLPNENASDTAFGKIKVEHAKSLGLFDIVDAFDNMQTESREERSIVTGNLLSGFDYVNGKGTIINYTTADGEVKQGIMLSRGFNFEKHHASRPIALTTPEVIVEWLKESGGEITGQGAKGKIAVLAIPARDTFVLTAPKSKSDGGEFFLNKRLTAAMGGEFVSKSNGMVASSSMSRAPDAIGVLLQSGVKFEIPAGASDEVKNAARALVEKYAPRETRKVESAKPVTLAPQVSSVSPETFRNWKKSVGIVGTLKGWTIFNDEVRGHIVVMNGENMAAPFADEQSARTWIGSHSLALDTAQPQRTMTQEQRGELDARRQQGMARRGGQESVKDQAGGLFSAERDQGDMFDRRESRRSYVAPELEQTFARRKELWKRLNERLKAMGIGDKVMLRVVDRIASGAFGDAGFTEDGISLIRIAMTGYEDFVLDHEVIHILRDFELFRPAEWAALAKAAQANTRLMKSVEKSYPDLSGEALIEEAVADMFAEWRQGRLASSGFARVAMQRILSFFDSIRRIFNRNSALKAEAQAVMQRIDSGEIGSRDAMGDPRESVTRESRAPSIVGDGKWDGIRERLDVWRTNMQDRMLPLLRTQQRIELQSGKTLAEGMNPYLAEELMSGKVGAKLEHLADDMVGPMFEQIKAEGLTVDEVETYLYARHAPERNARISEINSNFGEGTGSGMTDAEAQSIMERVDMEGKREALDRVAAKVDKILSFAINTRVEAGLLSQEEADAWADQYQHYVPLRGRAEINPEGGAADYPRYGSGINVRGPESKRAFGRESRAADILAYTIMQAEEAVVRAGRNEVAQAFYRMVKANPDPDMWSIQQVRRKPTWNKALGQVVYRNDSSIAPGDEPFTVSLKIDGSERRVTLNRDNPAAVRLASAMRNLEGSDFGKVTQFLSAVNRYLSFVNTGLNPEFVITNAFRDIQTASVNLAQFDLKGLEAGALKDYPAALKASIAGAFKKGEGEWSKWYQEFIDEGGRVYFNQVEDLNDIRRKIERTFTAQSGTLSATRTGLMHVKDFIENANNGVENAIRLSAYKNARERGMSKAQAASLAKNLTVNFNRRGTWGPVMNSLYLFYNASIQGTARMMQAAFAKGQGGKRVRRILGGMIVGGMMLDILNMMLSGDDDDGESYYDKISEFDKSRNLIIMIPGSKGEFFKIPLPYGYNAFFSIGRAASELSRGKNWAAVGGNLFGTIADAFNPVGGNDDPLKLVSPTLTDPLVDIVTNTDFAGRPIMPEDSKFGPERPDSQKYWGSVSPHWRVVTDLLNSATGGDEVVPGKIDISPETLEHLSGIATGAAGAFFERSAGLVEKTLSGEEIDANDLPLVRKLVGSKPSWYDKSAYYARTDEIEQVVHNLKEYANRGDVEKYDSYALDKAQILSLNSTKNVAEKTMRAIKKARGQLDMAHDLGSITSAEYRAQKQSLDDQQKAIISEFNRVYLETVDKPTQP
jgi:cell pole-organizing protein PopZ